MRLPRFPIRNWPPHSVSYPIMVGFHLSPKARSSNEVQEQHAEDIQFGNGTESVGRTVELLIYGVFSPKVHVGLIILCKPRAALLARGLPIWQSRPSTFIEPFY